MMFVCLIILLPICFLGLADNVTSKLRVYLILICCHDQASCSKLFIMENSSCFHMIYAALTNHNKLSVQLQCLCHGTKAPCYSTGTQHSYNCLEKISGLLFPHLSCWNPIVYQGFYQYMSTKGYQDLFWQLCFSLFHDKIS